MKRIAATIIAGAIGAAAVFGVVPAHAQATSAAPAISATSATPLDPEARRWFMALATAVLASFAANASKGSLEGFDPGPAIETALKNALASRDLSGAIDRLVDQVGRSADGTEGAEGAAASPEMRAMLKAALSGVLVLARSELARELSGMPAPGAVSRP